MSTIKANRIENLTTTNGGIDINNSGNVGIGTSSPDTLLTCATSDNTIAARFKGANGIFRVLPFETGLGVKIAALDGGESGYEHLAIQGASHSFVTGITERARIDSSGRLLLGTSSAPGSAGSAPYALLQVEGNTYSGTGPGSIALRSGTASASIGNNGEVGQIAFAGNDNEEFALIKCDADGATGSGDHPGRIVFSTTADGASSPTERMRILSSGGLTFNGDTAQANALDDYEEGTWTPAILTESGTNYTLSSSTGYYTKIGNLVYVEFQCTFTAEGSGTITIISIPFSRKSGTDTILNGFVSSGNNRLSVQYTNYTHNSILVRLDDGDTAINYWSAKTNWAPTNTFFGSGCFIV